MHVTCMPLLAVDYAQPYYCYPLALLNQYYLEAQKKVRNPLAESVPDFSDLHFFANLNFTAPSLVSYPSVS